MPLKKLPMAKYKLTSTTKKSLSGSTLYQIKALRDIPEKNVRKGDLGGWIESEKNLSQEGNAWVYGNAQVFGDAQVYGDARVYGNAWVHGNTQVYGDAWVYGNAWVYGDARVFGTAWVYGDARVCGNARVYGNALLYKTPYSAVRTDGYTFILTPTTEGLRIIAGCRYFTFEEAKKHWTSTRGGSPLGEESLLIVKYLEECSNSH